MSSKEVQTSKALTAQERDDIRSQHSLHPDYTYPELKRWFDEEYVFWAARGHRPPAGSICLPRAAHASRGRHTLYAGRGQLI